jgi:MtN3 and saliva related transmembrane protein
MNDEAVGLIAGSLTTAAWLPQLYRTWRSRSAADISWGYISVFGLGVALWFTYGLLTNDLAVVVANGVTFVLVVGLIVLKFMTRHRVRRNRSEPRTPAAVGPSDGRAP